MVAHDTGTPDALVLAINIGTFDRRGDRAPPPPRLAQTPPPNPTAAGPGDGRVRSRPSSRVHEPCSLTEAVALRSQRGLTGPGSPGYSYGGFGGGHPHFHPHTGWRQPNLTLTRLLGRVTRCGLSPRGGSLRLSSGSVRADGFRHSSLRGLHRGGASERFRVEGVLR